jgi:hypothetical protein
MGMLGALFPEAQFVVTGVLGPQSNAHGPNEFLHISFTKRIIAAVTVILGHHGNFAATAPKQINAGHAAAVNVGAMSQTTEAANADREATLQLAADKAHHQHTGNGCCP